MSSAEDFTHSAKRQIAYYENCYNSEKRAILKSKEFAPLGSQKSCLPCQNWRKIYQSVPNSINIDMYTSPYSAISVSLCLSLSLSISHTHTHTHTHTHKMKLFHWAYTTSCRLERKARDLFCTACSLKMMDCKFHETSLEYPTFHSCQ